MRVWQPGIEPRVAAQQVQGRRTGRGRRRSAALTALYRLARPYQARTALAIVSLLARDGRVARAAVPDRRAPSTTVQQRPHARARLARGRVRRRRACVGIACSYAQTYFTGWTGERMLADLRNHLFRHLQRLSLGFYERNRAGVLISRLTNDVEALDQLVTDGVTSLDPEHAARSPAPR